MVNCIREEEVANEAGPAPDALHHHGLGAEASGEPAFEEYGFDTVRFIGNNDQDKGVGRLCIRQRDIVWRSRDEVVIPFKHVSLSALADCPERYESPLRQCLYLQIDTGDDEDDDDDDDSEEEEEEGLREVHMFPSSAEDLEAMFKAMCDGALRNPDSDAEEEQGHMFFDMESAVMGSFADTVAITDDDGYVLFSSCTISVPMMRTSSHSCVSDEGVLLVSRTTLLIIHNLLSEAYLDHGAVVGDVILCFIFATLEQYCHDEFFPPRSLRPWPNP